MDRRTFFRTMLGAALAPVAAMLPTSAIAKLDFQPYRTVWWRSETRAVVLNEDWCCVVHSEPVDELRGGFIPVSEYAGYAPMPAEFGRVESFFEFPGTPSSS